MKGPAIIARALSVPLVDDQFGQRWQYHPRSDRHSKVACWAVVFDLLQSSRLLREHVASRRVAFGINRQLNDWETGKKKNLDMVVARARDLESNSAGDALDLRRLAVRYGIVLTEEENAQLDELPIGAAGAAGATVRQPHDTIRTLDKISEIRRRSGPGTGRAGFDALGVMLVSMVNDGSPVELMREPPAPSVTSEYHYDQLIGRAAHLYDASFGQI